MVAMGEWVFFRREAGGEKFQGEGHCCHNKTRLLSAELIEKLPLEPNVGLHEAPTSLVEWETRAAASCCLCPIHFVWLLHSKAHLSCHFAKIPPLRLTETPTRDKGLPALQQGRSQAWQHFLASLAWCSEEKMVRILGKYCWNIDLEL